MAGTRPLDSEDLAAVAAVLPRFPARDRALVAVLANTGLRVTEALSFAVGDVWDGTRVRLRVRVRRSVLKGGKGQRQRATEGRTIVINDELARAIAEYLFARHGSGPADMSAPFFPSRQGCGSMSRWQANRVVHAVLRAAGVDGTDVPGERGAHSWRKGWARRVYDGAGKDLLLVRDALGHRSVSSTQHYLCTSQDEVDRVVLSLGAPAQGTPAASTSSTRALG